MLRGTYIEERLRALQPIGQIESSAVSSEKVALGSSSDHNITLLRAALLSSYTKRVSQKWSREQKFARLSTWLFFMMSNALFRNNKKKSFVYTIYAKKNYDVDIEQNIWAKQQIGVCCWAPLERVRECNWNLSRMMDWCVSLNNSITKIFLLLWTVFFCIEFSEIFVIIKLKFFNGCGQSLSDAHSI